MSISLFLTMIFLAVLTPASADTELFKASVNRTEIAINQNIVLTFKILNANYTDFNFPTENNDYRVIAQASSSSIQIINGAMSQEKKIELTLKPKHAGKFTIPSASIKIVQNLHKTTPITINVLAQAAQNTAASNPGNKQGNNIFQVQDPVFTKVTIDKVSPYVNEQLLMRLKIYHRGNLKSLRTLPRFSMDDFVQEQVEDAREYREVVDGVMYLVFEIDYILFPITAGPLTIPAAEFDVIILDKPKLVADRFDPFAALMQPLSIERIQSIETEALSLNVKSLPPNAPKAFTGYVGDLTVVNELDSMEVTEGDALTLTSTVYGNGNISTIDLSVVDESQQYDIFQDKTAQSSEINDLVKYFQSISKTAIIPQKAGKLEILTNELVSFNPSTKKYETHGKNRFIVNVKAAEGAQAKKLKEQRLEKQKAQAQKKANKEILNIPTDQIIAYPANPLLYKLENLAEQYWQWLIIMLNLIALLIYALRQLIIHKQNKFAVMSAKDKEALKAKMKEVSKNIKYANQMSELSKSLKDLILSFNKYSNNDEFKFNEDLDSKLKSFFTVSDQANYAGSSINLDQMRSEALDIIKEIKKEYARL